MSWKGLGTSLASPSRAGGYAGCVCVCGTLIKGPVLFLSAVQGLIQAVQSQLTAVGRVGAWWAAGVGAVRGGGMLGRVGVGLQRKDKVIKIRKWIHLCIDVLNS